MSMRREGACGGPPYERCRAAKRVIKSLEGQQAGRRRPRGWPLEHPVLVFNHALCIASYIPDTSQAYILSHLPLLAAPRPAYTSLFLGCLFQQPCTPIPRPQLLYCRVYVCDFDTADLPSRRDRAAEESATKMCKELQFYSRRACLGGRRVYVLVQVGWGRGRLGGETQRIGFKALQRKKGWGRGSKKFGRTPCCHIARSLALALAAKGARGRSKRIGSGGGGGGGARGARAGRGQRTKRFAALLSRARQRGRARTPKKRLAISLSRAAAAKARTPLGSLLCGARARARRQQQRLGDKGGGQFNYIISIKARAAGAGCAGCKMKQEG